GMTQVTSYVPLGVESEKAARSEVKPAEIVRRGVFSKETKGVVSVRKYAIIDTHKGEDRSYPPFVVYFTDYSPGRKTPLDTSLRSAATLESATKQVEAWLLDNIKRGWSEVESGRIGEPIGALPEPPKPKKAPAKKAPAKKKKSTDEAS